MRVTIIPSDKMVYIDNDAIQFDFVVDSDIPTIHAIQWNGTFGHIEHIDEYNKMIAIEGIDSLEFVQPIVDEAIQKIAEIKTMIVNTQAQSNKINTSPTVL
jgi:hypothetical protein